MILPFDVNDAALRRDFVHRRLIKAVDALEETTPPAWGGMSARHMIEHLAWVFEASIGRFEVRCDVPEARRVRARAFLYSNRPTPKDFKNPALPPDRPPPLRYPDLAEAKAALRRAVHDYEASFREAPGATHTHPLFGDLGAEDWERTHYKHCFHHLLQFGLIEQEAETRGEAG